MQLVIKAGSLLSARPAPLTVSIPDLLEAAAAWKQSTSAARPDQADVAAALTALRERNAALSQLVAQVGACVCSVVPEGGWGGPARAVNGEVEELP